MINSKSAATVGFKYIQTVEIPEMGHSKSQSIFLCIYFIYFLLLLLFNFHCTETRNHSYIQTQMIKKTSPEKVVGVNKEKCELFHLIITELPF